MKFASLEQDENNLHYQNQFSRTHTHTFKKTYFEYSHGATCNIYK